MHSARTPGSTDHQPIAAKAHEQGLTRVDHVVLSDDAKRAYAVQGEMNSPLKRIAEVDVAQAVIKPVEQSATEWQKAAQPPLPQQTPHQQTPPPQPSMPPMEHPAPQR